MLLTKNVNGSAYSDIQISLNTGKVQPQSRHSYFPSPCEELTDVTYMSREVA